MKLLSILALLLSLSIQKPPPPLQTSQAKIDLTSFHSVPKDMMGCGDAYYLSEQDKKKKAPFFIDDLGMNALIFINNKATRFKAPGSRDRSGADYVYGDYIISIKVLSQKKMDDEYYVLKAIFTLKQKGKIVWQRRVIGDGGC